MIGAHRAGEVGGLRTQPRSIPASLAAALTLLIQAPLTAAAPPSSEPASYELVPASSHLFVTIAPDEGRLFSRFSHHHVVRATEWTGTVLLDPAAPEACQVRVRVAVSGLEADEPELRRKLGFGELGERDRRQVMEEMRGEGQLFAERYPEITFESDRCASGPSGEVRVAGALRIRGKSKRVEIPLRVALEEQRLKAEGELVVQHRDFGFEPYSAALGAIANGEDLHFHLRIIGRRSGSEAVGPLTPAIDESTEARR